jgi:gluconolactonase
MSETAWQPSLLYPDPAIITLDPRFERVRPPFNASVELLYTGCRWSEGPVWFGDGRFLLWSDIPNNRILKWEEETGTVSVFRRPSNNSNGNTRDRQGRLITCEHGARRVTRRDNHNFMQPLQREAAQFAERRGRQIGRLRVVYRPALRDPW